MGHCADRRSIGKVGSFAAANQSRMGFERGDYKAEIRRWPIAGDYGQGKRIQHCGIHGRIFCRDEFFGWGTGESLVEMQ